MKQLQGIAKCEVYRAVIERNCKSICRVCNSDGMVFPENRDTRSQPA